MKGGNRTLGLDDYHGPELKGRKGESQSAGGERIVLYLLHCTALIVGRSNPYATEASQVAKVRDGKGEVFMLDRPGTKAVPIVPAKQIGRICNATALLRTEIERMNDLAALDITAQLCYLLVYGIPLVDGYATGLDLNDNIVLPVATQEILVGREIANAPTVRLTAYAVRGLDINSSYTIYDLINQQKEKGVAVIFVGEDLDVLLELSDKILVLCGGEVSGVVEAEKTDKNTVGLMMTKIMDNK